MDIFLWYLNQKFVEVLLHTVEIPYIYSTTTLGFSCVLLNKSFSCSPTDANMFLISYLRDNALGFYYPIKQK